MDPCGGAPSIVFTCIDTDPRIGPAPLCATYLGDDYTRKMRNRTFHGALIALCLIVGCSSSSSEDSALKEALDRIDSLEKEMESTSSTAPSSGSATNTIDETVKTETTSTTTSPSNSAKDAIEGTPKKAWETTTTNQTHELITLFRKWDRWVYEFLVDEPVIARQSVIDESDWDEVLFYSGRENSLDIEICMNGFLEPYVNQVFERFLTEDLRLSNTIAPKILDGRTDLLDQVFEVRQSGFHIEWISERSDLRNCTTTILEVGKMTLPLVPLSTRIWITFEG